MYWTDWGKPAEIAYSLMDGTNDRPFVVEDIHWPNGLALDYPNQRLYWTDARKMSLESIRLDGTDRRVKIVFSVIFFQLSHRKGDKTVSFKFIYFENKLL